MLIALLAWLYGQVLIGCAVAAGAWVRLAWRRWKHADRPAIGDDAYTWVATGIVGVLGGVVAGSLTRVVTIAATGEVAISEVPWLLLFALILLSAGASALVWGSTIGRSPAAWRLHVVLSALYACATLIWRV